MNSKPIDYFALLELPVRFDLDKAELENSYRKQQSLWHPDRFVSAGDSERMAAVSQTSLLNDAFDTLRSPLGRIRHMLELQGIDTSVHAREELDEQFLFQQMEWREALHECELAGDEAALESLQTEVSAALDREQRACVDLLTQGDTAKAKILFHRLQFLYKLTDEIRALEDRLLDY